MAAQVCQRKRNTNECVWRMFSHTNESHFSFRENWDTLSGLTMGEWWERRVQKRVVPCRNVGMMPVEAQGCCHKCPHQQKCCDVPPSSPGESLCLFGKLPFCCSCCWMAQQFQPLIRSTLTVNNDEDCDYGDGNNGCQPAKVPSSQNVLQRKWTFALVYETNKLVVKIIILKLKFDLKQ